MLKKLWNIITGQQPPATAAVAVQRGVRPMPGEIWKSKPTDEPWPKPQWTVKVLDVKDEWVRYEWCGGSILKDERMKMSSFLHCYGYESASDNQAHPTAAESDGGAGRKDSNGK